MRPFIHSLTVFLLLAASALAADPDTFTVGAFTFRRPASMKWVPVSSPMRKATLRFEPAPGQAAEVAFYTFGPGLGGGADQNIARWAGQFELAPGAAKPVIESATIKGTKITRVRVENGAYNSGMPDAPATPPANFGLYGAIFESPTGDVFIKMTGPAEAVKGAAADFEALIQSPF